MWKSHLWTLLVKERITGTPGRIQGLLVRMKNRSTKNEAKSVDCKNAQQPAKPRRWILHHHHHLRPQNQINQMADKRFNHSDIPYKAKCPIFLAKRIPTTSSTHLIPFYRTYEKGLMKPHDPPLLCKDMHFKSALLTRDSTFSFPGQQTTFCTIKES